MAHWLLDLPLAWGCALALCFAMAWRAPLCGAALGVAAGASLWVQPQGEVSLRASILAAALLGVVVAVPRLASPLVALVEVVAEGVRARWRRPAAALSRVSATYK